MMDLTYMIAIDSAVKGHSARRRGHGSLGHDPVHPHTACYTMGGMTLMGMTTIGVGPRALLLSKSIDTLAAAGVLMADIWKDQRIVTVDMLGDESLETVQMGDPITVHEDGTVEVG